MALIPIRVEAADIHIHADRRLAFQVAAAFGAATPGADDASSRVLSQEEDGRLLVEFNTPAKGPFGRRVIYRTVEWVTLHEPDSIDFEGVEGPFSMLRDRFAFDEEGGCTRLRYESTFGIRGWVFGWLLGVLYVRPKLERFMREHLEEMKETIEARAKRSKVFPQLPCPWEREGAA